MREGDTLYLARSEYGGKLKGVALDTPIKVVSLSYVEHTARCLIGDVEVTLKQSQIERMQRSMKKAKQRA